MVRPAACLDADVQGFVEAKVLAKKFASLYFLLEDLLSPQKHYDWGLRAIKSVLVVAGSLLRAEEGQVESHVLFRALRDFNIPKILAQVTSVAGDSQAACARSFITGAMFCTQHTR
jgi:hypothetical protein